MSADATAEMASAPISAPVPVHVPVPATATAEATAPEQSTIEGANEASNEASNANSSPKPAMGLHSPPDSNNAMKLDGSDDSELSDLDDPEPPMPEHQLPNPDEDGQDDSAQNDVKQEAEEDEDIGEVLPDHWSGAVPIFKPDMRQFKDFKKFMEKIDRYGMKSGIVKIIPPAEWKDKLPEYHDLLKQIRVREPIKQDIMGSNGTYRQVNFLHQRSYNLPQWRQLCDQSEHQPPARRGERRANAEKAKPTTRSKPSSASNAPTTSRGRGGRATRSRAKRTKDGASDQDRPMTPVSPKPTEEIIESVEHEDSGADGVVDVEDEDDAPRAPGRMGASRQSKPKMQSTSARRKYSRREASARVDEEAFKNWDYNMDISDYTPERCEELERIYWKTLTYAPPLYGADLLGTLFSEGTELWNLNKLPNLLDVLGSKIPGVNTAYLYLGMWKATFAWHLEDVDLYSINYLHFGAPKQWYSISQGDARRFETAMKSIWPTDAKACDQFLRHKAFLISPNHLLSHFNIKVNKVVSYPGEFVVTYPYGYHSGYNLGYNCAEAVNFALDSWLPMGRIAKKCECAQAQDSVWIDVREIERKLRGESTDVEDSEDEEDDEEEEDDDDEPTRSSGIIRIKQPSRKRKRAANDKGDKGARKIRLRVRIKTQVEPPCCLCPNSLPEAELLPTGDGRKAHRICALYGPETWIESVDGEDVVANVANISKARLDLKCLYCRSKRGACFQCSYRKCARSYHATCAAAAGVLVEEGDVPIFGEDGTEYKEQAFEFSCRFHRSKRDKKLDSQSLDDCKKSQDAAATFKKGDIAQLQFYRGEIFAGVVVENRHDEQTFLIEIIPNGDRVEVEWKWLLLPDPSDFRLQKASPNAIPMPTSRKAKEKINATKRAVEELPRAQDDFVEGFTWAEFHTAEKSTNKAQVKVDFSQQNQVWHYLGRTSTEARAQYTEDPSKHIHNSKSNFLDTIARPTPPVVTRAWPAPYSTVAKADRPYQYKPKTPAASAYNQYSYPPQQRHTAQTPTPTQYGVQKYSHPPYTSHQFAPSSLAAKPFPTSPSTFALQPTTTGSPYTHQATRPLPQPPVRTPKTASQQAQPGPRTVPQTTPRPNQLYKPTAPHTAPAHSRNKSLPFSTDPRYRTSSTYGSARYDKGSRSPFSYGIMQPPGLGATPSPQNGQVFQAQARERSSSAASAMSVTTPMTSSAIGPSSFTSESSGWQPQVVKLPIPKPPPPSVLQKYAFFQAHHNRDSTKYRTPYAPWGGFTNGYEGNLRAHLMKSPDTILGHQKQSPETKGNVPLSSIPQRSSSTGNALANPLRPSPPAPDFDTSMQLTQAEVLAQNTHVRASPSSNRPNILQTASGPYDPDSVLTKLHPAIRAQYAAMLQRKQGQSPQQTPEQLRSQPQTQQSPHSTASNGISSPVQPTYENHAQHVPHAQVPYQLSQQSYATGQNISQTPLSHNGSLPMVQHMQQTSSGDSQGEVDGNHQDTATRVRSQTPQDRIKRDSPSTSQQFETTTPPQIRQVPHKQTPVPPPRPWEQLQRTTPTKTMPPPAQVQPLTTTPNGAPVSSQSAYNQGPQPTNVSGPFWQTHPQTMPNSNSLSPQPPFDPFQFINFQ